MEFCTFSLYMCNHLRDLEETSSSWVWVSSVLNIMAIYGVNQLVEDLSISLSLYSFTFQIKYNEYFKRPICGAVKDCNCRHNERKYWEAGLAAQQVQQTVGKVTHHKALRVNSHFFNLPDNVHSCKAEIMLKKVGFLIPKRSECSSWFLDLTYPTSAYFGNLKSAV